MRVLEHKVSSVDTVQSLAAYYLGDAARWREIVDFNNLDYPYITADTTFQNLTYASGTVTVGRPYTNTTITVPKGTLFAVPEVDGLPSRTYASLEDVTLAVGIAVAAVPIQCTAPGLWGDVPQGEISSMVTSDRQLKGTFTAIANMEPLTNGDALNVKILGDSLLIPIDNSWSGYETYNDIDHFYEAQFGIDMALGQDGDMVFDGYGDVGTVAGIYNLVQACRDRIITPKLSLVYHPEYGALLDASIAKPGVPYVKKMIALSIIETLLTDDRIDRVNVVSLNQAGTQLDVVVDVYPIQQGEALRVPFSLPNLSIV